MDRRRKKNVFPEGVESTINELKGQRWSFRDDNSIKIVFVTLLKKDLYT